MWLVLYCGSKSILPFSTNINSEIIENGLKFEDDEISALDLKKLICKRTNVPIDHLKLYAGEGMINIQDVEIVNPSTQVYFSILTCKNPDHCPCQLRITTLFGQFRAPFSNRTTVLQLKQYIDRAMKIPLEQQKLRFNGRTLNDHEVLADLNINDGSEIHLIPKTKGSLG